MLSEEKEETTLKDKINRYVIGTFMAILVGTLIITLIPNEAEQNFFRLLTGQDSFSAGKIGDENIPMDYFQTARRDCYQRYKDSQPSAANDVSAINSCAYSGVKSLKVNKVIAEAIGYGVSLQRVKEQIYEQAVQIHKDSSEGAGYADDEKISLEELYRNLLRSVPIHYRQDMLISMGLYKDQFFNRLETSESEKKLKEDAENLKIQLQFIQFSEADLLNKVDSTITITDEELKKVYDDAIASGNAPKNAKGEIPSFEERKPVLYNTLKSEKKQAIVTDLKAKMQALKSQEGTDILKKIAEISGSKLEQTPKVTLSELSKPGANTFRFASNSAFLKDLVEIPFGKGKVGGPYTEGNTIGYVEFKELVLEDKPNVKKVIPTEISSDKMKIYTIIEEVNQSVAGRYPVYRKLEKVEQ
jgi:hypothetical protein